MSVHYGAVAPPFSSEWVLSPSFGDVHLSLQIVMPLLADSVALPVHFLNHVELILCA
jgi:hypothetical protein